MKITNQQAKDFAAAHAEGLHNDLPREGCPECEDHAGREASYDHFNRYIAGDR